MFNCFGRKKKNKSLIDNNTLAAELTTEHNE